LAAARVTGFPADWIPPVALDDGVQLVMDPALASLDVLYAPGGEPGLLVGIRTEDLLASGVLVAPVAVPVASMR
jgi:prolyl-tRNA editing enzyme YbaK/EbsC (Cys-tRNA(Pro) deacylase)